MLSTLAVSGYIVPLPILPDRPGPLARRTHTQRPALSSEAQAKARRQLKEQRDRFDALYREVCRLAPSPDELEELAMAVRANEIKVAAQLTPQIERLRESLANSEGRANTPTMHSWQRLAEELLEIGITWLELYQNLQIRLLKLASDRRTAKDPGSPVFSDVESATDYLRKLVAE